MANSCFLFRGQYGKHSAKFKAQIVAKCIKTGNISDVVLRHPKSGIYYALVYQWLKKHNAVNGCNAKRSCKAKTASLQSQKIKSLSRQVKILQRAVNDLQRALNAL